MPCYADAPADMLSPRHACQHAAARYALRFAADTAMRRYARLPRALRRHAAGYGMLLALMRACYAADARNFMPLLMRQLRVAAITRLLRRYCMLICMLVPPPRCHTCLALLPLLTRHAAAIFMAPCCCASRRHMLLRHTLVSHIDNINKINSE